MVKYSPSLAGWSQRTAALTECLPRSRGSRPHRFSASLVGCTQCSACPPPLASEQARRMQRERRAGRIKGGEDSDRREGTRMRGEEVSGRAQELGGGEA
jgi:hypothetical protein